MSTRQSVHHLCIAVSVLYKNTTIGVGYRLLYVYIGFIGENSYWWNTRIYTKLVSVLLLRVHHVPCMGLNTATGEQQFLLSTASAHQEYTPAVFFCLLHVCYHCCGGCPEDMQLYRLQGNTTLFPLQNLSNCIYVPFVEFLLCDK